jgi:hypothetical protein
MIKTPAGYLGFFFFFFLKSKHVFRNKYNGVLQLQMYSKNEGIFSTGTGTGT